jgi:two-component system osmolarity sensor histidine kinase EnvZ
MRPARSWSGVWWRLIKRRLPTSLYGRSLLIIILPIVIMQIAVTYVFFDAHWQTVNSHLTEGLAGDVSWILQSYEADPSPANFTRLADRAQRTLELSIDFNEGGVLPRGRRPSLFVAVDRSLRRALDERLDQPFWFDCDRYPAYVDVRVKVAGGVLRIIAPKDRVFATRGHIFIFWMTIATVVLTAIAVAFIRNQVRAIERLAAAADAFGRGVDLDFQPHGAREVRQAARAFLAMKARIQRHVDQRTALLASVSHDLRTPMTRLKLELALSEPGPRNQAMKTDLAEMEHIIDDYLAFARGEEGEATDLLDLRRLIDDVSQGAVRAGARVSVDTDAALNIRGRPTALKRALSNLVMNAAAHGEHVSITARGLASHGVEIAVDDDGPVFPADRFEEAFTPFNRLDESRNQNAKGVGLGLAIARDVVRGHGGDLTLDKSTLGGLRAVIRLPGA